MVRGIYTSAIGLWWEFRVYSMIDIVMNFMMNLIFVYLWGAYGILLATALVVGLIGIPWSAYILFENYFGMKRLGAYLWELMKYMLITAVTGAVTYYICVLLPCKGKWTILAIRMILCIILPNFIFWVIYQRGELFKETVSFCKSAFQNYLEKSRTKHS